MASAVANGAHAQNLDLGKRIFAAIAQCSNCHGWAGHGAPAGPGFAPAPGLRELPYDRDAVREIVRCGIPGTEMPHFDRNAWGTLVCYGMTGDDIGRDKPPAGTSFLPGRQLEMLLDYVMAKVFDQGPVTREVCYDFFGEGAGNCGGFPLAAEIAD